jgi:lysophospholipase L1-like esterase
MIRRLVVAAVFLLLVTPRLALAAPQLPYYLALGDSLAKGVQPLHNLVETKQGFVDDLYGALRFTHPLLQNANLACSGETTKTMRSGGGPCYYPALPYHSQLDQALDFIQTHKVVLITISIGGDDVQHCISAAGVIDDTCLDKGKTAIMSDLPQIVAALRLAVGPSVPIVGANFYDPFLAAWVLLPPPDGPMLAQKSLDITQGLNFLLDGIYTGYGAKVADVAGAFRIANWSNVPVINIPRNVLIELTWTWIGAPPPRGPDTHPNAGGYLAMAGAFYKAIGPF